MRSVRGPFCWTKSIVFFVHIPASQRCNSSERMFELTVKFSVMTKEFEKIQIFEEIYLKLA